jgi:hypothetical protein
MRLFVAPNLNGEPDATIVGPWVKFPFPRRNRDRWVVLARDMTSAPSGCFDIGDPLSSSRMLQPLGTAARNAIADALGEARTTFTGMTRRQVLTYLLDHPSGAYWFQSVPEVADALWDADDLEPMFFQTKPVL